MILGKISVKIENKGGKRYFYARPLCAGNNFIHPQRIGVTHVVYVEKSSLTQYLNRDDEFSCYAIFDRLHSEGEWTRGFTKLKISPISEEIYLQLKDLYPQENHIFNI